MGLAVSVGDWMSGSCVGCGQYRGRTMRNEERRGVRENESTKVG